MTNKYSGFKNLVNNSYGMYVAELTSSDDSVSAVAFTDGSTLSLHAINQSSTDKSTKISLSSSYTASGTVTRTIWTEDEEEASNSWSMGGNSSWTSALPATSYVHFDIPLSLLSSIAMSVDEDILDSNINIFPNPVTNGVLYLNLVDELAGSDVTVQIYGVNAERVYIKYFANSDQCDIDVSGFAKGLYQLIVISGSESYSDKVVVM